MKYSDGYGHAELGVPLWCLPWWHGQFAVWAMPGTGTAIASCPLQTDGEWRDFVLCEPETLRAHAEAVLRASGAYTGHLSLDAYSLARNISTEVGSGAMSTIEEKMTLALSTIAHARSSGRTVSQVVLGNKRGVDRYGAIHRIDRTIDPETGLVKKKSSSPYGRWTSSSKDPAVVELLVAIFALEGRAGDAMDPRNFARGADDQAAASIYVPGMPSRCEGLPPIECAARSRKYWVGPIPNVNPKHIMLFRHMEEIDPGSPVGRALVARATSMTLDPAPDWQVSLQCQGGPGYERPPTYGQIAGGVVAMIAGGVLVSSSLALLASLPPVKARARARAKRA